jgi:hypothetical protein
MKYDEHMRAIGVLTVNFACLEEYLSDCISMLIGQGDSVGKTITSELSFKQLIHILGSLYKVKVSDVAKIEKLDDLLKRAFAIEQERNIIIHSWWNWSREPEQIVRVKHTAKRVLKSNSQNMTASDIWDIANEVSHICRDVQLFMGNI